VTELVYHGLFFLLPNPAQNIPYLSYEGWNPKSFSNNKPWIYPSYLPDLETRSLTALI